MREQSRAASPKSRAASPKSRVGSPQISVHWADDEWSEEGEEEQEEDSPGMGGGFKYETPDERAKRLTEENKRLAKLNKANSLDPRVVAAQEKLARTREALQQAKDEELAKKAAKERKISEEKRARNQARIAEGLKKRVDDLNAIVASQKKIITEAEVERGKGVRDDVYVWEGADHQSRHRPEKYDPNNRKRPQRLQPMGHDIWAEKEAFRVRMRQYVLQYNLDPEIWRWSPEQPFEAYMNRIKAIAAEGTPAEEMALIAAKREAEHLRDVNGAGSPTSPGSPPNSWWPTEYPGVANRRISIVELGIGRNLQKLPQVRSALRVIDDKAATYPQPQGYHASMRDTAGSQLISPIMEKNAPGFLSTSKTSKQSIIGGLSPQTPYLQTANSPKMGPGSLRMHTSGHFIGAGSGSKYLVHGFN